MKPYGSNDKRKNYLNPDGYWCNCNRCMPVKKSTKKTERLKAKIEIKKGLD